MDDKTLLNIVGERSPDHAFAFCSRKRRALIARLEAGTQIDIDEFRACEGDVYDIAMGFGERGAAPDKFGKKILFARIGLVDIHCRDSHWRLTDPFTGSQSYLATHK